MMARSSVSCSPNPLPHGATGTVSVTTAEDHLWVYVALILPNGDVTSVSNLAYSRGEREFSFGPTPTWDGTGGGRIHLELYSSYGGRHRRLATGSGTYL